MSLPVFPIATETSDSLRAGASFIPSPIIQTTLFSFRLFIFSNFSSGESSAFTFVIPTFSEKYFAVERLSPVRSSGSISKFFNFSTISLAFSLRVSDRVTIDKTSFSSPKRIIFLASLEYFSIFSFTLSFIFILFSLKYFSLPQKYLFPKISPSTPLAIFILKFSTTSFLIFFLSKYSVTDFAIGCSLFDSKLEIKDIIFSSENSEKFSISFTFNFP